MTKYELETIAKKIKERKATSEEIDAFLDSTAALLEEVITETK